MLFLGEVSFLGSAWLQTKSSVSEVVSVPLSADMMLPETSGVSCVSMPTFAGVGEDTGSRKLGPCPGVLKGVFTMVSSCSRKEGRTQGFLRKPWHPIRRRSSSSSSLSFTLLDIPGTTALSAIAPIFTIFAVGGSCSLKNLSALKPGLLSRSHFARKVFEPRLLLLPLFHSLSAKYKRKHNTMKAESKCGRRGQKGWLICLSDPSVPGMFSSVPTVATFPIRSRAKFPEPLPSNRNQSVTSGFPLEFSVQQLLGSGNRIRSLPIFSCFLRVIFTNSLIILMPSKFPCFGQKNLNCNATYL